jgi:hypothetical protein
LNPLRKLTIAAVGTALIASGVVSTNLAEAALFSFDFDGRGTTGHILFDDSIIDTNPDPLKGQYLVVIVRSDININGTPQTETGIPTFEIIQGSSGSVIVGLAADGIGACGLTVNCLAFLLGSTVFPPTDPSNFDLTFDYPAGSLLSDALPAAVPVTGEAILRSDLRQFFLGLDASASILPVSVPEPATFLLFAVGAGLTVFCKFAGKLRGGRRCAYGSWGGCAYGSWGGCAYGSWGGCAYGSWGGQRPRVLCYLSSQEPPGGSRHAKTSFLCRSARARPLDFALYGLHGLGYATPLDDTNGPRSGGVEAQHACHCVDDSTGGFFRSRIGRDSAKFHHSVR